MTTAPFEVDERPLLPSFLYLPAEGEFADGALAQPWDPSPDAGARVVGEFARNHGASVPTRLVASAKSWLSHPGVDRKAAILPIDAEPGVARVSPFEASAAYLADCCNGTLLTSLSHSCSCFARVVLARIRFATEYVLLSAYSARAKERY